MPAIMDAVIKRGREQANAAGFHPAVPVKVQARIGDGGDDLRPGTPLSSAHIRFIWYRETRGHNWA
jgi:hypothetical protein